MAQSAASIPHWLQMVWAISGSTALILAIVWTIFIFYPYLRRMEAKQDKALEMGAETSKILQEVQKSLNPIIEDIRTIVHEVRATLDQVKGALDEGTIKKIESAIQSVVDSLPHLQEWAAEQIESAEGALESHLYASIDSLLGKFIGRKDVKTVKKIRDHSKTG